jgi:hypothetical protein
MSAMGVRHQTVVELAEFVRSAEAAGMDDEERAGLIDLLALDPDAGISLGGGLYKVRLARKGQGKSGGFRVIYFYRDEDLPMFLLTAFAKNHKANISRGANDAFLKVCKTIAETSGVANEQG